MRRLLGLSIALLLLAVQSASAVVVGDPAPLNPCPGAAKFKTTLIVLDVSGDGSLGAGACANGVGAETPITCTSKEAAGKNIDVAIQYFDSSGALINTVAAPTVGNNTFCGVTPGGTLSFHTVPPGSTMPGSWGSGGGSPGFIPTGPAPMPISPCTYSTTGCFLHGTARVLSTSKKIECTATRLDLYAPCNGGAPGPLAVKNLTIVNKKQQGD
jgi:hypothetical protein